MLPARTTGLSFLSLVPLREQVGVFVSLVSTKIPFKGAGKEYIGAALGPGVQTMQTGLTRAACCCVG